MSETEEAAGKSGRRSLVGSASDLQLGTPGVVKIPGPESGTGRVSLSLHNSSTWPLTFKAKTSLRSLYAVKPAIGFLAPGDKGAIEISRLPFPESMPWAKYVKTRMGKDNLLLLHTRLPFRPDPKLPLHQQLVLWWGNAGDTLVFRRVLLHPRITPARVGFTDRIADADDDDESTDEEDQDGI